MAGLRVALAALFLLVAVTLQMSTLPQFAIAGVTCDVALLVVVALGLSRGPEFGAIAGFAGGLLLDLAPPADHTAGRWALALALSGYVAGSVRRDALVGPWAAGIAVVICTALYLTVFTATGSLLHDPSVDWGAFGVRLGIATGYDLLAAVVVLPLVMWAMRRVVPPAERRRVLP